jgi:hypothetical protein
MKLCQRINKMFKSKYVQSIDSVYCRLKRTVVSGQSVRLKLSGLFLISLLFSSATLFSQTNYYSKSTGNLNLTANWGTSTDGSGTAPLNFTSANQIFNIRNRAAHTVSYTWTVSGAGSKVVVGDGTTACVITLTSAPTWVATEISNAGKIVDLVLGAFGTFNVLNGGEYQYARNGGSLPVATWQPNSTLNITGIIGNPLSSFTSTGNVFGNIIWNCTGQTILQSLMSTDGASITVKGDFSVFATGGNFLRPTNTASITVTLNVEGSLTVGDGVSNAELNNSLTGGPTTIIYNIGNDLFVASNAAFAKSGGSSVLVVNFGIAGKSASSIWGGPGSHPTDKTTYTITCCTFCKSATKYWMFPYS